MPYKFNPFTQTLDYHQTGPDNLLRGKYVRSTRFEILSSGTTGVVTLPPDSEVVLDDFGGTTDALLAQVSGGKPEMVSPQNSSLEVVAVSFDSLGNWIFTSTPTSYPVAIIYRVRQTLENYDSTASNIWGVSSLEQGGTWREQFETVSKNLKTWNYSLNYTSGNLSSMVYTNGIDTITKTFNYTGPNLTSIVLSGDTPNAIFLTKTFTYSGSNIIAIAYS